MANLQKAGFFATAESHDHFIDYVTATLPPEHRVAAITAGYMLWNLAVECALEDQSAAPRGPITDNTRLPH